MRNRSGRCLCGATRFETLAAPLWQGHCHCRSCRLTSAAAYTSYLTFGPGEWRWLGQPPAIYTSSPGVERMRCATCGTPMGYAQTREPGKIDLFAATLDDPTAFRPSSHIFWSERLDWVPHDHSLPHLLANSDAANPDAANPEAAAREADEVLALIRAAFAGMEGRIDPPSSVRDLSAEMIAYPAAGTEIWVSGSPARACAFLTAEADHLYISKMAVASAHRREGLARKLIVLAEERARALQLPALQLQCRIELVENHLAFEAMGFYRHAEGRHRGYDRTTSITFRKEL